MSTDKKFTPTPTMIEAADAVFMAMAKLGLVEPIVLNYQRLILKEGQWLVKRDYLQFRMNAEVVLDPDHVFLLGEADFAVYDSLCKKAQVMVGLQVQKPGNCPLLEAKAAVVDAKAQLAQSMASLSGHTLDQLLTFPAEMYEKYIHLSLKLLAPFVDPHKRYGIPKFEAASCKAG
jgi:hypothetical protein